MGTAATESSDHQTLLETAVLFAFPWGVGRRIAGMWRAGDILSVVTVSMAGLRAAVGTTALVNTHGPNGNLRPCWIMRQDDDDDGDDMALPLPNFLDAPSGSRGTTAMTGLRMAADLGKCKRWRSFMEGNLRV